MHHPYPHEARRAWHDADDGRSSRSIPTGQPTRARGEVDGLNLHDLRFRFRRDDLQLRKMMEKGQDSGRSFCRRESWT